MFGTLLTILWRIRGSCIVDCSHFMQRNLQPRELIKSRQYLWKKRPFSLFFLRTQSSSSLQLFLRLFQPAFSNCTEKYQRFASNPHWKLSTQRENTERQRMPTLFSPDFLHQLSSLLPLPLCRSSSQEIWAKKHKNKAAKEKRKQVKAKEIEKEEEGKERHNSSLITAPSSRSVSGRKLFWMPYSSTGSHFSVSTTAACLTAVGKDATWLKRTLASCKSFGWRVMFLQWYTWVCGLFMWQDDHNVDQLNFPPSFPSFSFCGLFHYVSREVSVVAEAAMVQKWGENFFPDSVIEGAWLHKLNQNN